MPRSEQPLFPKRAPLRRQHLEYRLPAVARGHRFDELRDTAVYGAGERPDAAVNERAGSAGEQTRERLPLHQSPGGSGRDGPVELRFELLPDVVAPMDGSLGQVLAQDLRRLRQVVRGHELPRGSGIPPLLRLVQKPRLVIALARSKGSDLSLYRIEIVPTLLAEEAQPYVQDRGPSALPPIVRIQRERRPSVRNEKSFDVRATFAENAETSKPHERLRRFRGCAFVRQDTGNLKSLRGGSAEIFGVSVIKQNGDAEFERIGDEAKAIVVEASGSADVEGVLEPAAPCLRRGVVDFLPAE